MRLESVLPEGSKSMMLEYVKFPGHNCNGKLVRTEPDTLTCQKCHRTFHAPQKKERDVSKQGFKMEYPYKRR